MLDVLAGVDLDDPRTLAAEGVIADDYTDLLAEDALQGVRIGVVDTYFNDSNPALAQVLADLEAAGGPTSHTPWAPPNLSAPAEQ